MEQGESRRQPILSEPSRRIPHHQRALVGEGSLVVTNEVPAGWIPFENRDSSKEEKVAFIGDAIME